MTKMIYVHRKKITVE